jgi:hypothetical protein
MAMTPEQEAARERIAALERDVQLLRRELSGDFADVYRRLDSIASVCESHRRETADQIRRMEDAAHQDALKIRNALIAFGASLVITLGSTLLVVLVP